VKLEPDEHHAARSREASRRAFTLVIETRMIVPSIRKMRLRSSLPNDHAILQVEALADKLDRNRPCGDFSPAHEPQR